jgi:type VI protein secretion system component VasA
VALPDVVRFFVHLEPRSVALDLIHALRSAREEGRVSCLDEKGVVVADKALPQDAVRWVRVDTEEAPLVSARQGRFRSSALLGDLFAFPESFCFFDLRLGAERSAKRVEVAIPLAYVVHGAAALSLEHLRLFCTPATNQFVSAIEPVRNPAAFEAVLSVPDRPHAEVLEVRSLSTVSIRDAQRRTSLPSWEAPEAPRTFEPGVVHYALEQSLAPADDRTDLRAIFGRLDAFPAPAGGMVEGEVLACDGALTRTVGLGEVGSLREGATNITRATPSRRALLGRNWPWRMSAYARMPAPRLAERARLNEFLRLHDPHGLQDEAVRVMRPDVLGTEHAREHELEDGVLAWGDAFVLDVHADGASDGELWLAGALVHMALAERNEALRFCRLTLRRDGAPFADYAARRGARLPFPLG